MATIGTFKKTSDEYTGEIVTLTVQAKKVRIVPADKRPGDSAPTHRVFAGSAEIGAGWTKTSQGGRDYLSLKLDDPSFAAPVFANLVEGEDGESHRLLWSRQSGRGENDSLDNPTPPGSSGRGTPRHERFFDGDDKSWTQT